MLGCLPDIFVRNTGGKVQGTKDMEKAINDINDNVTAIMKALKKASPPLHHPHQAKTIASLLFGPSHALPRVPFLSKHGAMPAKPPLPKQEEWSQEYNDKFLLLNIIFDEGKVRDAITSRRGTVLIVLNNPHHLKKLKDEFTAGARRWFPAKLMKKNQDGHWEVKYDAPDGQGKVETLGVSSLKKKGGATITDASSLKLWQPVSAKKSETLRTNEGLLPMMEVNFGLKKVRMPPERPILLAPSHQCGRKSGEGSSA